jgi:hypothetical protein
LVPEIPNVIASSKSIGTDVEPVPGELTELILKPMEAGNETPTKLALCVEEPPFGVRLLKE